ncbi:MAG: peptidase C1 [Candidatus Marinimicrobia bacterium CG08_land_8_20_14_0_20_45_22]|nr:MAG: peptidase C1 [Candidatus Marinimicrobia bacterium CG08_land_8_20_14_0_20_45_22]
MKSKFTFVFWMLAIFAMSVFAQNKAEYIPKTTDAILDSLEKVSGEITAKNDSITAEIKKRQDEQKETEKKEKKVLKSDLAGVVKPKSLEEFKQIAFYFPPVAQYLTGTCWCFSGTSYLESEVERLTQQKIKLSEMYTVYWEYVEKARRFVTERSKSVFDEGSECNAVLRIMNQYGAVPAEAYTGLVGVQMHNHTLLVKEVKDYLEYCKMNNYWDEETVIASIKIILSKHLGVPPTTIGWNGKMLTPIEFYKNVLKINSNDYVDLMSTTSAPFYEYAEFKVPDNWWHDKNYYNIPLDKWYAVIKQAIGNGMSVAIGGDVSEAGYIGKEDVGFIPDFDIPYAYINQDSREFRIENATTEDDHGLHLVGMAKVGKYDWFLIKDSGRSSRYGQFKGFYLWREDFVKLKMLSFTVHKDAAKAIITQLK